MSDYRVTPGAVAPPAGASIVVNLDFCRFLWIDFHGSERLRDVQSGVRLIICQAGVVHVLSVVADFRKIYDLHEYIK